MRWALLAFLGTTGVVIVGLCIVALFVRGRMRRRHRISPKVPTAAPLTWLADPRAPARLHRRLAHVGRTATAIAQDHRAAKRIRRPAEPTPIATIALDLRHQAVRIDHEVARVALLVPAARRLPLQRLGAAVADLEQASARLASLSAEVRTPPVLATDAGDITDVAAQVDRLTEAHRILLQLDEQSGLTAQR